MFSRRKVRLKNRLRAQPSGYPSPPGVHSRGPVSFDLSGGDKGLGRFAWLLQRQIIRRFVKDSVHLSHITMAVVDCRQTAHLGSLGRILRSLDGSSHRIAPPPVKPATPVSRASRLSQPSDIRPNIIGNTADSDASSRDPPGERFLQCLRDGIQSHRLIINDAKALVHTAGTAFLVSPGLFQRYAREHPAMGRTARAQRSRRLAVGAEALRANAPASEAGQRTQHLDVRGRRSSKETSAARPDPARVFEEVPFDNPLFGTLCSLQTP